jgi:enoyl-CoA hydratase
MEQPEPHEDGDISVEARGAVLLIGLNRPKKMNGMTPRMFEQLVAAYARLDSDSSVRVGVLHAHGQHFTAGLDLPKFAGSISSEGLPMTNYDGPDPFALRPPWRTKPVIAAVKGVTYTAGLELALAADVIIAGSDARLAMLEPKRGLMPTGGASFRFIERGGWGNAMRWLLTGDEFGAEEGVRLGIVQEVTAPEAVLTRAIELAETIAQRAPLAVQAILANGLTYAQAGEAAAIAELSPRQSALSRTQDFQEGVQSFVERRQARFQGR